ncbi:JMJD7 [Branchiostoma lanceolatum]|uniref:JMJD7 protein n=1 Tax=Branchiostoma lanceolatum TaxID=7740 RepID=A0A8J9ZL49_BRALA|nr:JMJD7 [Branchiostoma lanceolatum]
MSYDDIAQATDERECGSSLPSVGTRTGFRTEHTWSGGEGGIGQTELREAIFPAGTSKISGASTEKISGKKEVILFEPNDSTRLYEAPILDAILWFNNRTGKFRRKTLLEVGTFAMSPVDILKPNFKRFPKFAEAVPLNCTIDEGEVLYMPAHWWHEVQSYPSSTQHRNLAINFWYEPFLTKEFPCQTCSLDVNPHHRHLLG